MTIDDNTAKPTASNESMTPAIMSGQDALARLMAGNTRYVESLTQSDVIPKRPELVAEQRPFAIILGCSDARVPVEIVFDQGLGDLFVIRVAGNIVAPSQIGSIEFAVEQFGTRLVVVLGHSNCGAVTACVDTLMHPEQQYSPALQSIVDRIRPSVHNLHEMATATGSKIDETAFLEQSIKANVRASVNHLKHGSRLLEDMSGAGELLIVGAEYSLQTGGVTLLD